MSLPATGQALATFLLGDRRLRRPIGMLLYSVAAAAIVGSPAVFVFTAPHVVGAALIGAR
jgi:hypothetical protein